MSIFSKMVSKILHRDAAPAAAPVAEPVVVAASAASATPSATPAAAPAAPASPTSAEPVDVAEVLTALAAKSGQKLDWKKSIVDLMKLLDLDSSLASRKELAAELHYTGDTADSATMNIWLHKAVMQKLAENGGKVPDDLKN
jgi:3-oxoacyl-ACP reductase-like protein